MDYQQTIHYLYENLPMFHRIGPAALKNDLSNTKTLDNAYGFPHQHFKTVHIAGTNGKGSVSHMLAAIFQSAGYKTGLFTSPHLIDFRERIKVNGEMIPENDVVNFVSDFIERNKILNLQASFFELTTIMAFDFFRKEKVDIAIVEVGLGGRLDSTNIITPELSVITNISFDHTAILGHTLDKIASEKAGIIKTGVPVIIGESHPKTCNVFLEKASQTGSPITFADEEFLSKTQKNGELSIFSHYKKMYENITPELKGDYQQKNILTVIAAIEVLKEKINITDEAVRNGIAQVTSLTGLQGRWQQLCETPRIICDTGHNEAGMRWVAGQLKREKYNRLHIVFGMVSDKDTSSVLALLPTSADYYFTKAPIERALDEINLKEKANSFGLNGNAYPTVKEALDAAKKRAGKNDLIFVGGSTFIVAEILTNNNTCQPLKTQ
ncbi:MAG TPA: folylpolyglutamate synthase/dihydrofolate synthase family protein [Prolixibacteraceae bacterium]|nr:folylpolyglutamate synthase/dihydrofolate synthase family protein [Prolixibacteraceae bacterium]